MAEERHENEKWGTQDNNDNANVQVREGHHRDTDETVSEFIVADKQGGEHHHIGINEDGNEVFHTTRDD